MALATTTLSSAVAQGDSVINVASATSVAAGRLVLVDQEVMQVAQSYTSGTEIPVLRGRDGSAQVAHASGANATHGSAADFAAPAIAQALGYPVAGRSRIVQSISASGAVSLPTPGNDAVCILNGTSVIAATVAAPTKDMDGSKLAILANGAAAHTVTFTGGLSLAGTSYDVLTMNGTKPAGIEVYACNGAWIACTAPAMGGTVTNLIGSIA